MRTIRAGAIFAPHLSSGAMKCGRSRGARRCVRHSAIKGETSGAISAATTAAATAATITATITGADDRSTRAVCPAIGAFGGDELSWRSDKEFFR